MFNLIVAVLSIALIGITAGASVYYGGTAFSNSNNRGQVSALISAGGQIGAAQSLHRTERGGVGAASITDLISSSYLQAQPSVPTGLDGAGAWRVVDGGKMAILMIGTGASTTGSAPDLVCNKVVEEGGARLVAVNPSVSGYAEGSVLTISGDADSDVFYGNVTVVNSLDLAGAVDATGYNDGRRVNFGCLNMPNATYFGYRI